MILGLALLSGLLLASRWFASADPKAIVRVLKWLLFGLIGLIVVYFVINGRLVWAFMTLPVLLPWLMRLRSAARMAKNFSRMASAGAGGYGAGDGQASEVETRYLKMTLDHASGAMNGEVREGPYAGRSLQSMSLDELVDLLETCRRDDPPSSQVLEAYLDRVQPGWRENAGAGHGGGQSGGGEGASFAGGAMSREEALKILGLEEGASKEQVKEAHHRLMAGLHPDHGGSNYLASKINQAKEVLEK